MRGVVAVPIFLIERRFAEDLEASAEVNDRINRINEEEGVRWLYSFLAADKRKTYCLYEAPFADAIRRAAVPRHARTASPSASSRWFAMPRTAAKCTRTAMNSSAFSPAA